MEALAANGVIRNWALKHVDGLAICEDTQRFNALVALIDEMANRAGKGGSAEDIKAYLIQDLPLRIPEHRTAVKNLQEHADELLTALDAVASSGKNFQWPKFPQEPKAKVEKSPQSDKVEEKGSPQPDKVEWGKFSDPVKEEVKE